MKLLSSIILSASAEWQQPTYKDILAKFDQRSGGWGAPTNRIAAEHNLCPALDPVDNAEIICDQATCAVKCDEGFIPVGRRRTKCRFNQTKQFFWKKQLGGCDTCADLAAPPAGVTMTCGVNKMNRKKCTFTCDNGSDISAGDLSKPRLHAVCACPRPDRICRWNNRVFGEISDDGIAELACNAPPATTEAPGTTQGPVVTTTQGPVVTTTQGPVVTTTQGPVVTTTQGPVVTTTQAPVVTTTQPPATTTAGEFTFNADGTGGSAPAVRHYAVVNGEANAAATGHGPHAADGQVCADGGYLAAGISVPTEMSQIGQCVVSKVMPCATAAEYAFPLGNNLNGAGANCAENFKWAWLNNNNNRYCHMVSVKESADGSYVLAAGTRQSTSTTNNYNGYVVKIDSATGATIWEFDYLTGAGSRSGFETIHLTSDGGFIVGGFINRVDVEKPGFKSGGQVDQGIPVMHKFSAAQAASSSAGSPTPEWTYACDGSSGRTCNLNDGSVKNMRVFTDGGVEKVVGLPTSRSILLILDAVTGAEIAYSGDGLSTGFIGDGTANDIEVEKNASGIVTGYVTSGLRAVPIQTDNGVACGPDGCSVITGSFTKYKADLSASEWKLDLQTGEWPGGANQFASVVATPYKSLVYTECWGLTSVKDGSGAHVGYAAACGTGVEPGCEIHPGAIQTECNNDVRKAWRGAVARIDLAGNLVWYSINSYQAANEEAGGAMESGESASEYIFQTPEGRLVSVTDEGFGGFGFLTFECEAGTC